MNTTFVLLAPDGKTAVSGVGRAPRQLFRGTDEQTLDELLKAMKDIAARYPTKSKPAGARSVPYLVDVRRAVNVAACDNQPLIVVSFSKDRDRVAVEKTLANLAWSARYRGRFAFARSMVPEDLDQIENAPKSDGVFVVQPGTFGLKGKVIAIAASIKARGLSQLLDRGLKEFVPRANDRRAMREGLRKGVSWKSESIEDRKGVPGAPGSRRGRQGRRDQDK